jgi:hypothetical protein
MNLSRRNFFRAAPVAVGAAVAAAVVPKTAAAGITDFLTDDWARTQGFIDAHWGRAVSLVNRTLRLSRNLVFKNHTDAVVHGNYINGAGLEFEGIERVSITDNIIENADCGFTIKSPWVAA